RHARLEQLLHTGQSRGDVVTGHTTLVEGTHGQLRARLTDRLCGDNADGLADVDQLTTRHRATVAAGADTGGRFAGEHTANLDLRDSQRHQLLDRGITEVVARVEH